MKSNTPTVPVHADFSDPHKPPAWADYTENYGAERDGASSRSHWATISAVEDPFAVSIVRYDEIAADGAVTPGEPLLSAEAPNGTFTSEVAVSFAQALKTGASRIQQLKEAGE